MLAIVFAGIIISFVLLSFGNIFISLYNRFCKREEQYNIPDIFILGICFTLIPLSLSSLWLPSNHYILLIYFLISIGYWLLNKKLLKNRIHKIKETLQRLSIFQKIVILLSLSGILLYTLYCACWPDALYYHYQQIRWNEDYPAIQGLANLEDRFGFNSNYLLLSAIFSFRFLFGEPLYVFQSILFVYVTIWVFNEVITSKFHISRLFLLLIFLFFFSLNSNFLADSSTDIIPNICTFYYIARFTLYPDSFKKMSLFAFTVPIALCTFKLSVFPLCLVAIYIFFYTIKEKKNRQLIFLTISSACIVILWLIRNVIISGYLVYPLHELDLFSFDWKVAEGISRIQREIAIDQFAKGLFADYISFYFFERTGYWTFKRFFLEHVITVLFYLIIVISPFFLLYKFTWKKRISQIIDNQQFILYISLIISLIYWFLSAPDVRFISGIICGATFFILNFVFHGRRLYFARLGTVLLCVVVGIMFVMSASRANRYHTKMAEDTFLVKSYDKKDLLLRPFSAKDQVTTNCYEYKMNDLTIYLSKDGGALDIIPSTKDISPEIVAISSKLQSVETIEARGNTLQEGFRVKKEYVHIIDSISEELIIRNKINWW